jgi:hypothetical protein
VRYNRKMTAAAKSQPLPQIPVHCDSNRILLNAEIVWSHPA